MMTTKTSPHTWTVHVVGRDGETALCRRNLKAYRPDGRGPVVFLVKGDDFGRSCDRNRTNCDGCRKKLDKLVAEAWDAAQAENETRSAGPRERAARTAWATLQKTTPAQNRALRLTYTVNGVRVLDGRTPLGTVLALRDRHELVDTTTHRFEWDNRRYSRLSNVGIMAVAILRHGFPAVLEYARTHDAADRAALEDRHAAEREALEAQHADELANESARD